MQPTGCMRAGIPSGYFDCDGVREAPTPPGGFILLPTYFWKRRANSSFDTAMSPLGGLVLFQTKAPTTARTVSRMTPATQGGMDTPLLSMIALHSTVRTAFRRL